MPWYVGESANHSLGNFRREELAGIKGLQAGKLTHLLAGNRNLVNIV